VWWLLSAVGHHHHQASSFNHHHHQLGTLVIVMIATLLNDVLYRFATGVAITVFLSAVHSLSSFGQVSPLFVCLFSSLNPILSRQLSC
jgi:hypothetical protein